ncbi:MULTISPECIES: hypothetical protein [unclassified Bradyrhizobium]|jgi:hypothetical protein|uniref:hypothetical protein n=1 Tax=unclassified Bradyrhizobium TaxID=2631580 RepID=UPI001CD0B46A|nr:hypothetical protein [Bradyrhizobium sp. 2S1]
MPYTHESRRPTQAQREAQKAFRAAGTKSATSEHQRVQNAFHANRERLKAERLEREAAASSEAAPKKKR